MKRLLTFSGIIAWVVLIGFGIDYILKHPNLSSLFTKLLAYFGGIVLIAFIVWVILRVIYGKDWILGFGKQIVVGNDLIKATDNFLGSPSRETTANLLAHLVYRFTRLGLIGLLLAMIPIWLLYQQNTLLIQQNKRLDQQTYLQEAERRSSLVFLFSNVMDAIDKELKEDVEEKGVRDLSPQLIGRIIALSNRLKPYQYLDGDTLISKPLSPERGQLLVSLVESNLDTSTMNQIFEKATFKKADLKSANLENAYLKGATLTEANFQLARLANLDLREAGLREADLRDVDLEGAVLNHSDIVRADLRGAMLKGTSLRKVWLSGANLRGAWMINTDLRESYLDGVDFKEARFININLYGTVLIESTLNGVIVERNFIQDMKKDSLIHIYCNYVIDSIEQSWGREYFLKWIKK